MVKSHRARSYSLLSCWQGVGSYIKAYSGHLLPAPQRGPGTTQPRVHKSGQILHSDTPLLCTCAGLQHSISASRWAGEREAQQQRVSQHLHSLQLEVWWKWLVVLREMGIHQVGALWGCLKLQDVPVCSNSVLWKSLLSAAAQLLESFVSGYFSLLIDLPLLFCCCCGFLVVCCVFVFFF